MKKSFIFPLLLLFQHLVFGQTYNTTFSVDMSSEIVDPVGVFIVGNLQSVVSNGATNNWTPCDSSFQLTLTSGNIYSITLPLPNGVYAYKFMNGISGWESTPDRMVSVVNASNTLQLNCFNSFSPCPLTNDTLTVELSVNMHNFCKIHGILPTAVSVAGDFQKTAGSLSGQPTWADWIPGQIFLFDADNDSIYNTFFKLKNKKYQFKFLAGTAWGTDEYVPSICAAGGNREMDVKGQNNDTINFSYCFNECTSCGTLGAKRNVTFQVDMTAEIYNPDSVFINGSMNFPYGTKNTKMNQLPGTDYFTYTQQLYTNRMYAYQYKNDTKRETVNGICGMDDFAKNRKLTLAITANDTILPNYEFGSCFVSGQPQLSSISGRAILDSKIYLIRYDAAKDSLWASDSTTTYSQGSYDFYPVMPLATPYRLKVAQLPTSSNYQNYLPTYYGNTLFWDSAQTVVVGTGSVLTGIDIYAIQGNNPGGSGFISGLISAGANKVGDKLGNVTVLLLDDNKQPVAYTYTNAKGEYSFSNIPLQSLQVYPEITGRKTTPKTVVLSAAAPSATADFEVKMGVTPIDHQRVTAYGNSYLYPNPASDNTYLRVEFAQPTHLHWELYDILGQKMSEHKVMFSAGAQQETISLKNYSQGIYFLHLYEGNIRVATHKLVRE